MNKPLLSILIPTLDDRKDKLESLKSHLESQRDEIDDKYDVQIIHLSDNREMSTGSKRQHLLWIARGQYSCFVDDDDNVSDDYIPLLVEALRRNPTADCTSLKGQITFSDGYSRIFEHSLKHKKWIDDHKNKVYYRPPNHLNAIRTDFARKAGFPSIYVGEDRVFSMKVLPMLNKEAYIDSEPFYLYNARGTFEEIHNGLSRDSEEVVG